MFERSYERLEHVRGRCRGHRHDETINVGLLLEVLEIMEDVMDASVALNQVSEDVKTLLTDVSTKIQELVDAVNAGNSVTTADLTALDRTVKDGITSVQGTQVPGTTPAGGGGAPAPGEGTTTGGTPGTTTGGSSPDETTEEGAAGSVSTAAEETAPGSGVSGAAGPVQGDESATPGNAAQE